MRSIILLIFISISILSCREKAPVSKTPVSPSPVETEHGMYVINEGSFTYSNGSVSLVDEDLNVEEDLFKKVNQRPLGDVVQSMAIHKGKGYIVVNNSSKIEIVSLPDFRSIGVINDLPSPKYLLPLNDEKALVSDLYGNAVSIVNLNSNQVIGKISLPGWTEEMLKIGEKVFLTNQKTKYIYIIDAKELKLTDSILVGMESNSLVADKNGKLWVLTAGGANEELPSLNRIDPNSHKVEQRFEFGVLTDDPGRLRISPEKDKLFFINKGIYKMGIEEGSVPANAFIPKGGNLWYSLAIDPQTGNIHATDAVDYVQRGYIFRFNATHGGKMDSLRVGIVPVNIQFF